MKIAYYFVLMGTLSSSLSPAKTFSKVNSLSKAGKTVRKFMKGVSEFVSGRKPNANKSKSPKKTTRPSLKTNKSKRHSNKKIKTTRPTKAKTTPAPTDSESGGFKNFAGQLAIASVGGGGLTMLQNLSKDDVEYEYEYEYVTSGPDIPETTTNIVSYS